MRTIRKFADTVPHVLAVMATAGLYDDSGKWLTGNTISMGVDILL